MRLLRRGDCRTGGIAGYCGAGTTAGNARCVEPDFNVSTLAREMHFSPAYLGRVFAGETGGSLKDYILEQRIKRACNLLSHTLIPIVDVAAQCGYANSNYFTKAFRSRTGDSPSEYRRKNYHE